MKLNISLHSGRLKVTQRLIAGAARCISTDSLRSGRLEFGPLDLTSVARFTGSYQPIGDGIPSTDVLGC